MTRPHGYARYRLDGCRCYTCGYAASQYEQRRQRLIAYGRWRPFVPIDQSREQLLTLAMLGYGHRHIAALTGLGRKTIRDIAAGYRHDPGRGNPPLTKIRAGTATAILAVDLDQLAAADHACIDAARTTERIHALIALGYPRAWIAAQLGKKMPALQLRTNRVTTANARAVLELYQRIGDRPGPCARARAEGHANGWLTPFELEAETAGSPEEEQTA